jgi:ribose 5-phosphate isomerase B
MEEMGHEVVNYGVDTTESCDYPVIGEKVGRAVAAGEVDCAILICGTGVGISLAANKVKGVRAAVCSDTTTAHLVREHNHANILAFGARIVGIEKAKDLVKAYLEATPMEGRHAERVAMLAEIEQRS